jgi:electron transport complex protein RnfC
MKLLDVWHKLRGGSGFDGGVVLDMHKQTAASAIIDCPLPPVLIHPLKQHIGASCTSLVNVGDTVLRGQKIGKSEGYISAPVHAGTSGRVVRIEEHTVPHPSGLGMPCIFIEADGEDRAVAIEPKFHHWSKEDPAVLRERVRLAGITGLGGAGFPTYVKLLKDQRSPIHTVIINGVECEPWLTHDHRMLCEQSDAMVQGLTLLLHLVGAKHGVFAIEDNKPDAIAAIQEAVDAWYAASEHQEPPTLTVQALPTRYPQGSEKQLIQAITGREVPAGKLPMHVGVLCQNVGSTYAIAQAICHGHALTERVITVSGDAMPRPANMRVRLGTPMRFVFAQCGLTVFDDIQIIHGGPMMGERLKNAEAPVVKATTGLLAMQRDRLLAEHQMEEPCIRCGHCGDVCPVRLVPNLMADFSRQGDFEKAEEYQLFDCIECGCCSHVCPSHIPLVHYFRYGKGQLAQIRKEKAFAEASRQRSEQRMTRIEQEKAEKAARRSRVRAKAKPAATEDKDA